MNDKQIEAWDADQAPINEIAISVSANLDISVTDMAVNANTYIITGSYSGTFTFPRSAFLPEARYDNSLLDNESFQVYTGETEVGQPTGVPPFFSSLSCTVLTYPPLPGYTAPAFFTKGTGTLNLNWQHNHAVNPPANSSGSYAWTPTVDLGLYRSGKEIYWQAFFSPWGAGAMPPDAWQNDWPTWSSLAQSSTMDIDVTTLRKLSDASVNIGASFSSTNPANPDSGSYTTGAWDMVVSYTVTCS